jgi:hypothetical protein
VLVLGLNPDFHHLVSLLCGIGSLLEEFFHVFKIGYIILHFYDFSIVILNYSGSVVFFFVFFILFQVTFFLSNDIKNNKFKRLNFIVQTYCRSWFFDGVRVAHLFSFFCCPIMYLYVLSSMFRCLMRLPHKNDVRFVFTSS